MMATQRKVAESRAHVPTPEPPESPHDPPPRPRPPLQPPPKPPDQTPPVEEPKPPPPMKDPPPDQTPNPTRYRARPPTIRSGRTHSSYCSALT
jgi:hypothetical protein